MKLIDLTGQTFGKLTVVTRSTENDKTGHPKWECECECGNKTLSNGADLRSGKSQSCGCDFTRKLSYGEATFNELCRIYKRNAEKNQREFSLSDDDVRTLSNSNCYYCNTPPSQIIKSRYDNGDLLYTGIDRIDSDKGYTIDNVRPCCEMCNFIKGTKSEDEFLEMVKSIYEHHNLSNCNTGGI